MNPYNMNGKLWNLIAATIHDIIAIHGLDGECRYISPSVQKVLGFTPEEIIGTSNLLYCHPEDAPPLTRVMAQAKQGQPVPATRHKFRYRTKDGEYLWLESEVSRILDAAGNPAELLVISRDVTARKKADDDLRKSYERLALALYGAKAGVWDSEDSGAWHEACRPWWAVLGYAEGDISSRESWLNICHPDDRETILKENDDYLAGRRDRFELEYRVRHKDGGYRWVLGLSKVMARAGNKPHRTGMIIDVTDLKELEARQRESETRLRDFARALPDVSMIVDESGRHIEVFGPNDTLFSLPYEEVRKRTMHQVLPAKDADYLLNIYRRVIETRRPHLFNVELTLNRRRRLLEARVAPMNYLADGNKTVAVVFTDVSEKKRAESMLEYTLALRRRSNFLDEILDSRKSGAKAAAEAKAFGIDLSRPLACCIVRIANPENGDAAGDVFGDWQIRVSERLSNEQQLFVWDCRGDIGVLIDNADAVDPTADEQVAESVLDVIASCEPRQKAVAGVGNRLCGVEGLRKSYRQAASAALVALNREGSQRFCHFRAIGIYKFLASFSGEELAREYVQDTLGKLLEYDLQKGTGLLCTLEAVLESASLKEAAKKLFLHYNTAVRHRRRIEKLLGVSLEDADARLALAEAIKLRKLGL